MNKEEQPKELMIAQLTGLMKDEVWLNTQWSHAAAKATGLHPTDLNLLTYVYELGPAPAGHLARVAGLTTGATTAAINRLERAGFVDRTADEEDGRKVMVHPVQVPPAFRDAHESARDALLDILSRYTLAELDVITSSRRQVGAVLRQQIKWLKTFRP